MVKCLLRLAEVFVSIFRRTSDSHLTLEEHSLTTNLHGNSLSVQIEGAPLLPSVVILETGGQVLILSCSVTTLTFMAFRFPAVVKTPVNE